MNRLTTQRVNKPQLLRITSVAMLLSLSSCSWFAPCGGCIPYPEHKSLHGAASRGDIAMMEDLLKKGGDVNEDGRMGDRPLHQAAEGGHLEAVEFLVAHGADVRIKDEIGVSPLHEAARKGHVEIIRYLVGKGVDINVSSHTEMTPLHDAAENGHTDAVAWMLDHGAKRDTPDMIGKKPLDLAIENRRTDVVKVLLGNGSLLRGRKSYANQLLIDSAGNEDLIPFLLDHGADVNTRTPLRDPYGDSGPPLSEGNETPLQKACGGGRIGAISVLVERGAKVNTRDAEGTTPLIALGHQGGAEAAALLLEHGESPHAKDKYGRTALHYAAENGNLELARFLIDHGVKPDVTDQDVCTPLHRACAKGERKVAMLLLDRGANINARSDSGDTPLMMPPACDNFQDLVDFLLEKGANVNARNKKGDTALHDACSAGNVAIIKKLLRQGAEVNVSNESGDTPLHEAVYAIEDDPTAVKLLLSAGADLWPRNHYFGNTPLHQAALKGNLEIAKALVRHGADVDARNKKGRTTWEEAYSFGREEDQVKVHDYLKSKSRISGR